MRRNQFSPVIAAMALLLAGPLAAEQPPRVEPSLSRQVEATILQLSRYGPFDMISFQVTGDTVTLLGGVATAPLKEDSEKAIAAIPGVARIVNKIEVLPLSKYGTPLTPMEGRGDEFWGPGSGAALGRESIGRYAIHIIVNAGCVTLYGLIDNDVDRAKAIQAARGVPGVLSVEDKMEPAASRNPA